MEEKYYKQLGHAIRTIRRSRELSQEYMAFKLNISQNMYSKIESGKCRCSIYRLISIMDLLDTEVLEVQTLKSLLSKKYSI